MVFYLLRAEKKFSIRFASLGIHDSRIAFSSKV